jgi:hypothetical protein
MRFIYQFVNFTGYFNFLSDLILFLFKFIHTFTIKYLSFRIDIDFILFVNFEEFPFFISFCTDKYRNLLNINQLISFFLSFIHSIIVLVVHINLRVYVFLLIIIYTCCRL